MLHEVFVQRVVGAPVGHDGGKLADHEAGDVRRPRLDVLRIDAVVPDERIRHGDDLATVARIGQDLLVARQRGIEDDFAVFLAIGTDRYAFVDRSVFQCQEPAFALVTHLRSSPACDLIKLK